MISVQPVTVQQVAYAEININKCILFEGLYCNVYMYSADNSLISVKDIAIVGEEYNQWSDDGEMQALILSKCGLIKSSIVPIIPESPSIAP